jgi:HK97 family phage prohead protease
MYIPTKGMQIEAERAIKWKEEGRKGGTRIGLVRARQILRGDPMSLDIVKRMYSYFSRHEVDKKAEGFEPDEKGYPSAGRVAWGLWGGDAGFTWSKNIVENEKKQGYKMQVTKRQSELIKRNGYEEHGGHEYNEQQTANQPDDIYTFIVSTPEVDRYGTIIVPSGIDYTSYLNNPIVLAQHDSDDWPIGKCLGFAMNGENLEATLQLHRITDEACEVADLVAAGFVKAVSVGIIPLESEEKTIDGKKVTIYTKSELVEFSIVSIPANREALIKKSIEYKLKSIFKTLTKVTRMLTPEQTQAITDNFLPVLKEATITYLRDELGIPEDEAIMAAELASLEAGETLIEALNGNIPEVEPTTVPPQPPVEAPQAPETAQPEQTTTTANFKSLETRVGKKIAASTQSQISQGLSMIQEGYKTINKAIAMDTARSIDIKPLKRLSTDELLNLI